MAAAKGVPALVKEAFLRGELVRSKPLAERIGTTYISVNSVLRQMSDLIECISKDYWQGYTWRCKDIEAMRAWKPKGSKPRAQRRAEKAQKAAAQSTLCEVWGIRAANLSYLPSHVHRVPMDDDEPEAA